MKTKVIVGMSGGVDSSLAAFLLKESGYQVEGLFMKNWDQDDDKDYCPAAIDLADAKAVAEKIGIPLHTVNFADAYWEQVFSLFLEEYAAGRTPNPDVLCNKEIKFKAFLAHALEMGADYIATGHYAKVKKNEQGIYGLYKSKDRDKDQTYFLHAIDPTALEKTLFPIGELTKDEVRKKAKDLGLMTHDKKDSTGICFIGERKFKHFLNEYILAKPGLIKSTQGELLGNHDGLMFYTLGQRQGLGIGGRRHANDEPWYVVEKDIPNNILYVAQGQDHPMLYSQGLITGPIHWLLPTPETLPLTCMAKTRYRQPDQACMISPAQENQHYIMFANLQRAITPGQYIVFYQQNQCLGGAIIKQNIR